jgi:tetratricopeptide (TPR) repeat protein
LANEKNWLNESIANETRHPVPGFFVSPVSSMLAIMSSQSSDPAGSAAARELEGQVWQFMEAGDLKSAAGACQQMNSQFPEFASGWHTASQVVMKLGNPKGALAAIEKALSFEPDSTPWAIQRARCLATLGDMQGVSEVITELSARDIKSPYLQSAIGMLYTQLGQREKAVEHYENAAMLEPKEAVHFYNIACMQRSLGDLEDAEVSYTKAISLNPADYESFKIRSDLRVQSEERNHVDELEALLDKGIDDVRGEVQIRYSVAKELEDLGESKRSFEHLRAGSEKRRRLMQYDVERDIETINAIKATFQENVFEGASEGSDNDEAIFILGMPRTGTTLVERILASHSEVFAAGELNNLAIQLMGMLRAKNAEQRLSRDEMVRSSADLDFARLGELYVRSTRPMTGHTARFIDKLPLNYLYVGLIRLALPNATIINLQRNPMDTCYAVYKQLFVDAYPFSYDLEELARYYVAYHQLMEHWRRVLPGVIHTVRYEELIDDVEGSTRRLLDACGLEWQPQCLKFYENKEASTTASTAQIRRPVYRSSIGKWREYEDQLQPVAKILTGAGISIDG